MSELIVSDVQNQEIDSAFIELFELQITSSSTLYFHPGLDDDLTEINFRDKDDPSQIRTYVALPALLDGIEINADGPQNRPTLTVANVASTFRDALGGYSNNDLIGKKLVRRQTLKKYLHGESEDSSPPVEFPIRTYVIDRVSGENSVAVEFELASPFDVSGIKLPGRVVVGKFCPWVYQGYHSSPSIGACSWASDSVTTYPDGSGGLNSHKAYFTIDDEPIVPASTSFTAYSGASTYSKDTYVSDSGYYYRSRVDGNQGNTPASSPFYWDIVRVYTTWATGNNYSANITDPEASDYVERDNKIWRCLRSHSSTSSLEPSNLSPYWVRADVCGKTLSACKARFQFVPVNSGSNNSLPSVDKDTKNVLPFGGFPGSHKFR